MRKMQPRNPYYRDDPYSYVKARLLIGLIGAIIMIVLVLTGVVKMPDVPQEQVKGKIKSERQ